MNDAVEKFWNSAINALPELAASPMPQAWAFGNTKEMADELSRLVVDGVKTGTSSRMEDYDAEGDPLPEPGQLSIVLDGSGDPVALIRSSAVEVLIFSEVADLHAWHEGEGDRSLSYWRAAHQQFWSHSKDELDESMLIVYEKFELVYASV
ncbi:MAG: ASCH domain-containing protein [Kocuria sp.]|nr:ASCH domain-containing protein [Kocuria sp.]